MSIQPLRFSSGHRFVAAAPGASTTVRPNILFNKSDDHTTQPIKESGNRMMLGEHDYKDKRWMNDESIWMPVLVRYLKPIKTSSIKGELIYHTDIAPTR